MKRRMNKNMFFSHLKIKNHRNLQKWSHCTRDARISKSTLMEQQINCVRIAILSTTTKRKGSFY